MKRKNFHLGLPFLCLLLVLFGLAQQDPTPVINSITIQPDKLATRIVLESETALPAVKSSWSRELPATLVFDLGKVEVPQVPPVPADDSPLLTDLKVQKAGSNAALWLGLKERVPYRYYLDQKRLVIELNKIQRSMPDYLIASEIQRELKATGRKALPITKIDVSETSDTLNLTARLGQKGIANIFALANPLRLVVDIFDTVYPEASFSRSVGKFGIEKVRAAQFMAADPYSITRLVVDLKEPNAYAVNAGPSDLVISFPKEAGALAALPEPAVNPNGNSTGLAPKLDIPPAPAAAEAKPQEEKKASPKVEPAKAVEEPESLAKVASLNTPPAAPPVSPAAPQKPADDQAGQFKPKTIHSVEQKFTGELLSPKFKDADLRDVILWLGERVGLNVTFDYEVKGTVTCSFEDVPWDQFLDIILKDNKMGKALEGNVLRIAPTRVLAQEADDQLKVQESKEQAGPISTKTVTLSYAKARDVYDLLKTKKSVRGEIVIDERTNTLIISDVKEKFDIIEKLITVLDTPTPQVSIEARIVEATTTFARNLGVQWGYRAIADPFYGNQTSLSFPNKMLADGSMIPQGIVTKGIGGPLGGYAVNLPAPAFSSAIGFSFANVLDTLRLDIALSALETQGQGQIISCPKVTTQNNLQAEIVQGRQIPVQTQANFTVTTRYFNAALELRATPQITAEGTIIMTIDIQNNAADFANLVNGIPPITTQSAKTTVMVPDGGTTVIGGIYRIEDSTTRDRVPFLHQIPILGNLFKSFSRTKQNR
jgi:type IV pilus assembly protein PilQ